MNIEEETFKDYVPIFKNFEKYGFLKQKDLYTIEKRFLKGEFIAKIQISKEGRISAKVYDLDNQEYIPLRIEGLNGAFIWEVRNEYKKVLSHIRENCFVHKSNMKPPQDWLIPANPKVFDIDEGFRQTPELEWHRFGNVKEGDTVYIYMAAPIVAIIYKCRVIRANLQPNQQYKTSKPHRTMYLKLIRKYDENKFTRDFMKQHGVGAVRGFRSLPEKLRCAMSDDEE